jgi:hypothetical protein
MEAILKMWQSLPSWLHQFIFGGALAGFFTWIGKILDFWDYLSKKRIDKTVKSSAVFRLKHTENKIHEFNSSLNNLIGQPYGPENQKKDYPDWRQPKWREIFALNTSQIDLDQAKKDLDLLTNSGYPESKLSKCRSIFLKQRELIESLTKTEEQISLAYKKSENRNFKTMSVGSDEFPNNRANRIGILGQTENTKLEESTKKLIECNASILIETDHENVNSQSKNTDSCEFSG